ncbi:hypothetical protein PZN02_003043 [Sinorhizobium garamanticum]|uniref:XRE family transcriptional regulator n=2 Tax=Sinorhizobium garamanticum TaxID=680247 RepID=A0ABY8DF70_9HYPH|nr:hypothetical protein [Sinorhizobium garamanticum]WEX89540.1 hypothetical protein PZN02_003043 [Sinorhizobium garamanticum]
MTEISLGKPSLNAVYSVYATAEHGVFVLDCNVTDAFGETYDAVHCYRPDDSYGLSPLAGQWLADNTSFPVQPYVPPTPAQIRASMSTLTARQLRLGLLGAGISPSQVDPAINALPRGQAKDSALIEWEYARTFDRMHPLVSTIGAALGLTDDQIDLMWSAALGL